jgi:hypothetical protein
MLFPFVAFVNIEFMSTGHGFWRSSQSFAKMLMESIILIRTLSHETALAVRLLNAVTVAIHWYLKLLLHQQPSTAYRWGRSSQGNRNPYP